MSARIGLLLGLPVLAFLGWLLWTEVIQGNGFITWQEEIVLSAQQLSPDLVSEFRAGSLANYPGFVFRLTPQDEAQFLREKAFWEGVKATRTSYDTLGWSAADQQASALLERLETSHLQLPWLELARESLHPASGWHLRNLYLLAYQHHIGSTEDCDGYIYRLREYPDRLAEALRAQESAAAAGRCLDSSLVNQTVQQLRAWAATPIREQLIYRRLATRMTRLDPTAINEYQAIEYLRQTGELIEKTLVPAWLAAADRLEKLACANDVPFSLSGNVFFDWSASLAGLPAPDAATLEALKAQVDSLVVSPLSLSPAAPVDLQPFLKEIAQATEGILPEQLYERVRLQQTAGNWAGQPGWVIPGTKDSALFPIISLPDSGQREALILDLYQLGVPGAAWMHQWLVESPLPAWRLLAHNADQQAGWGLAALELLHTRILWFSRDSALQQAYHRRMAWASSSAWLDAQLHGQAAAFDVVVNALKKAGWSEADLAIMKLEVTGTPGHALARWLVWHGWQQKLAGCEGDVRVCLMEAMRGNSEVGR